MSAPAEQSGAMKNLAKRGWTVRKNEDTKKSIKYDVAIFLLLII